MRRFAVIGTVVIWSAFPVLAQHGGGHGGGGMHAGAPSRGGFGASAPVFASGRVGSAPHYTGGPRVSIPQRYSANTPYRNLSGRQVPASGNYRGRYPYSGSNHDGHYGNGGHGNQGYYRRTYVSVYHYGYVPWAVPWVGWVGPYSPWYGYGYGDGANYDDSNANQNYVDSGYNSQPVGDEREEPRPQYQPPAYPAQAAPQAESAAATLIFKDGRAPIETRNYMLSRTTVFVMDAPQREIPVAQLDVAATERVNREAGVDFQLPAMAK
jgi:hypothetical protein